MAYDKNKLYNQCLKAIEKYNLYFIEDVVAYIPCSKQTFYDHFPLNSDELDTLKEKLEDNKIKTKSAIRAKLYTGSKASELIALYKLIGTEEERKKLSQNYINLSGRVESEDLSKLTLEELEKRAAALGAIEYVNRSDE